MAFFKRAEKFGDIDRIMCVVRVERDGGVLRIGMPYNPKKARF